MMEWKILKENNDYEINIDGYVRNRKTKKIKNFWITTIGYKTVSLGSRKNQKTYYIHRLIANNFIDNPNNYNEVNHIDGNKANNDVSNLEWCTHKHNMREAFANNLVHVKKEGNNPMAKKVKQTNLLTGETIIWDSMTQANHTKGYSTGRICDACKGKTDIYKNSVWEYV